MAGNLKWRFSFWPVAAFIVMLPALIALGVWQVQRGIEKRAVYDEFERAAASDIVDDATAVSLHAKNALPAYAVIRLRGRYLNERTFLLDNMSHAGRPGHHVLTPFQPQDADHIVIVDRGWRAGLARDTAARDVPRATSNDVVGKLAPFPRPGLSLSGKPQPSGPWPRVVQFPDAAELAAQLDRPVVERRLLLDEQASEGFLRDWQPPGIPPARHYAYAFQWFALAIALVVIFFVMARPRRQESDDS